MKKYFISSYQNDLFKNKKQKKYLYKTISFNEINTDLEKKLTKEIKDYFQLYHLSKNSHIFIVGLGKDYHTPDSVGPNTLKNISVNAYLENLGIKVSPKISSLKPGVLGETGILSEKTVFTITREIKPNLVILIDSFVCDDIEKLNHIIELNNKGLNPGSGLMGITSIIDENLLKTKILVIGVPTSLLVNIENNHTTYLLSTKDIDDFVTQISKVIGNSLNNAIMSLK